MTEAARRFDRIERVVRDTRSELQDTKSTVMSRMASHAHTGPQNFEGDVEIEGSGNGVILTDRINGNRYRLFMSGGVLGVELA